LKDLIYGGGEQETAAEDDELSTDTLRFDINPLKLQRFKVANFKRLLKKKFVTG
jgi:hypothetical protein